MLMRVASVADTGTPIAGTDRHRPAAGRG